MANDGVDIGCGTSEQVDEASEVEGGLLEVEVQLRASGLAVWPERGQGLSF